jgi:hypothetical protein
MDDESKVHHFAINAAKTLQVFPQSSLAIFVGNTPKLAPHCLPFDLANSLLLLAKGISQ